MKPAMRLANSTTYWMALVMWCAHCCHIHSADCGNDTEKELGERELGEPAGVCPFLQRSPRTLFWYTRVSSAEYCTQVNLFMSSALYWHVSR